MLSFFIKTLAYLPLWMLYGIADVLFVVLYYGAGYRKKVVLANLEIAFPDHSQAKRNRIAKDFYRDFCDFLVEVIKSFRISEKEIIRRVRPTPPTIALLHECEKNKQSFFTLVTHHMNWEWISLACSAEFGTIVKPVYKPLSNKKIDTLIFKMRSRFGGIPIPMKETKQEILKQHERATTFVLVADQTPASHNRQYWTTFFGKEVPFFVGVAHLAPLSKLPVYFIRIKKVKRGYYEYAVEEVKLPPFESPTDFRILDSYAQKAEAAIRDSPRNWLWTHRRWKRLKKEETTEN